MIKLTHVLGRKRDLYEKVADLIFFIAVGYILADLFLFLLSGTR